MKTPICLTTFLDSRQADAAAPHSCHGLRSQFHAVWFALLPGLLLSAEAAAGDARLNITRRRAW